MKPMYRVLLRLSGAALLPLVLVSGLVACSRTVLLSENIEEPGLIYYLPKTIAKIEIKSYGRLVPKGAKLKRAGDANPAPPGSPPDPTDYDMEINHLELTKVDTYQVADRSRAYSLYYEASAASHDRVCMGVNDRGLLATVEVAADDKTGDIIVSLAKVVGRLIGPTPFADKATPEQMHNVELRTLALEIDPLDRTHWQQLNKAMRTTFGPIADRYKFRIENIEHLIRDAHEPDSCPAGSVCYRTRVPVRFMLGSTSSLYHEVVSRRTTGTINVTRALMVEKITRLSFKDGVLVGANIKKPSEGLAVAKLPLTVMDAIVTSMLAAPGDFISKASGLPNATATKLIEDTAKNAAQVKDLQDKLKAIREGDLSPDIGTKEDSKAFELKCTLAGTDTFKAN